MHFLSNPELHKLNYMDGHIKFHIRQDHPEIFSYPLTQALPAHPVNYPEPQNLPLRLI